MNNTEKKVVKKNFKDTLKRFEEEKKAHEQKLETIRKNKMEQELKICTKTPHLNKNKNKAIKKEFFERQKEYSENAKKTRRN